MTYEQLIIDYKEGVNTEDEDIYGEYADIQQDLIWGRKFEKYNKILAAIDVKKSSALIFVGILRTAFMYKEELPLFDEKLEEMRLELNSRGEDGDETFRGLDRELTKRDKDCNENFIQALNLRK